MPTKACRRHAGPHQEHPRRFQLTLPVSSRRLPTARVCLLSVELCNRGGARRAFVTPSTEHPVLSSSETDTMLAQLRLHCRRGYSWPISLAQLVSLHAFVRRLNRPPNRLSQHLIFTNQATITPKGRLCSHRHSYTAMALDPATPLPTLVAAAPMLGFARYDTAIDDLNAAIEINLTCPLPMLRAPALRIVIMIRIVSVDLSKALTLNPSQTVHTSSATRL